MRATLLGLTGLGLVALVMGGSCLPVLDTTFGDVEPADVLALNIGVNGFGDERRVEAGAQSTVTWSAGNLSGQTAYITILVESRIDLSETVIEADMPLEDIGGAGGTTWDTSSFAGPYQVIGRIRAGEHELEQRSESLYTVDLVPSFEFTAPASDVTIETDGTVVISWEVVDDSATVRIGLDTDADHEHEDGDGEEANEVFIHTFEVDPQDPLGSFEWDGTDLDGNVVADDTYFLFAEIRDPSRDPIYVDADAQITVDFEEDPEPEESPEITSPATDVTRLPTESVEIAYEINRDDDTLVDVKLDADDDHRNGNEITIVRQELVEGDTDPDSRDWGGTDADGTVVPAGIYNLFLAIDTGGDVPETVDGPGRILIRDDEDQPLIALLAPASVQNVDPGDYVTIRWRDDDPTGSATIRVVLDDDNDPDADVGDQTEILSDRDAAGTGVQDRFSYQIPSSLAAGTYYVIAYIEADGGSSHASVAPAAIVVADPAATDE